MTKLLKQAMLSPEMKDEIVRIGLTYAGDEQPATELTPDEEADLAESEAAAARGEFATDEQVRAIWSKHGL